MKTQASTYTSWIPVIFAGISLIWILTGSLQLFHDEGAFLVPKSDIIPSFLFIAFSIFYFRKSQKEDISQQLFYVASIATGIVLFSNWFFLSFNFFSGATLRGEILLGSLFAFILIQRRFAGGIIAIAILIALLLPYLFLRESGGYPIYTDDHATFFFRLSLLRDQFPNIPFYYPFWNAGWEARDFFATGALSFFFLSLPALVFYPVEAVYNILVASPLFLLLPLSIFYSTRVCGFSKRAAILAALLSICSGLPWYRWALKYGTMGFICATALIPINLVLISKVLSRADQLRLYHAVLLVTAFSLMVLWSPAGLVFIPLILSGFVLAPRVLRKRYVFLTAILILLINLPWIGIFWNVSGVNTFLKADTEVHSSEEKHIAPHGHHSVKKKAHLPSFKKCLKKFRSQMPNTNIFIFLLGIPGLLLLRGSARWPFLGTVLWLFTLGVIIDPIKPQLELERMLVVLNVLLSIPAGALFHRGLQIGEEHAQWRARIFPALCSGFLFTSLLATGSILLNRTVEQYTFRGPQIEELIRVIQKEADDGRTLFSGFSLHQFGGGHLAPLTELSGKPLIASSHVHNLWKYRQVFPSEYITRKDTGGIEEYINLYNISLVVAHEREWRQYFQDFPEKYDLLYEQGRFQVFRVKDFQKNYFLKGSGKIATLQKESFTVNLNSNEAILKFNYLPFLKSSHCTIYPHEVSKTVIFIGLRNCPENTPITIKAKSVPERFGLWGAQ